MFCQLYGLPNCIEFKSKWDPIAHHILLTGESFNWENIFPVVLKEAIENYQKVSTSMKSTFYMSGYVMDVFCATSSFPTMGWNWTKTSPLVHIYCSNMWEDNFIPWIYEICDHFIGSMYKMIFKGDSPTFSKGAKALIYFLRDWYVGEYFSYIHVLGSNTIHLLPRIVSDMMVL